MGKIWKKLCALTGLFALLMFSPLGLLADPGSDAPTGTEVGSPMENETLKANYLGSASFASTAAEIVAANESSGYNNGRRNIVSANETTEKAENIPFVGSIVENEALNSGNESENGIAEEDSSATDPICVSVIVPVYNTAPYLDKCLDSLVNQTLGNIEIICINDGSTDGSGDILAKWAAMDPRIRVIIQENKGLSCARNNGMKAAKGEYLGFVDSDDWISRDFYEKLYGAAKREDADMAAGSVINWHSDKKQDTRIDLYQFHRSAISDFSEKQRVMHACVCWNKVYRRELILKNGIIFLPKKKFEDGPFTFAATIIANKIALEPTTTYFYRINRKGSIMSQSRNDRNPFDIIDGHLERFEFLEKTSLADSEKEDIRKFAEVITVDSLYCWLQRVNKAYKEEFFEKYKAMVGNFDLTENPYADDSAKRLEKAVKESSSYAEFSAKMNQRPFRSKILHRKPSV
ncbi:MAG: glycosyltransferase [Puniceicoccales bacterium]|jgi:glycosyltransferase involved in cell wall biosynthesis|nr:glycosyltransferase [Puniceicoccales bacterium]